MSGEIVFDCCLPRAHLPLRLSPRNVPTMKPSTYLPRHQLRPTPTSDWVMSVAQAPYTAIRLAPASSAPRDTITSVVCRSDRQDTVCSPHYPSSVAQAPYTVIRLAPASSASRDTITSVVCRSDRQDTVMSVARPGRTRSITVLRPVSVLVRCTPDVRSPPRRSPATTA